MSKKDKEIKKGDKVLCYSDKGFSEATEEEVVNVTTEHSGITGRPYTVIHLKGNRQFNFSTGKAITEPLGFSIRKI